MNTYSETRITNEAGRTTGHFCLAVELGIACLRRGRLLSVSTRGKNGKVTLCPISPRSDWADCVRFDVGVSSGTLVLKSHEFPRDAVEHFIALVGEKAAFRAIQHAASHHELADGSHDPSMVECFVAGRDTNPLLGGEGTDELSYGYFATRGNTRKWGFIIRYGMHQEQGRVEGCRIARGAACLGDITIEAALARLNA